MQDEHPECPVEGMTDEYELEACAGAYQETAIRKPGQIGQLMLIDFKRGKICQPMQTKVY